MVRSRRPLNLAVAEINVGVPIQDVVASLNVQLEPVEHRYLLSGKELAARALGGKLLSHDFSYELAAGDGHANVMVEGVELNQLLTLEKQQFESTGRISGSVPVQIANGTFSIEQGQIAAVEPGGSIKFNPGDSIRSMAARNAQMKMVIDAMSNFQYHTLDAELNFSPGGVLKARTSLAGHNPAFENGREIHFNLNLEENVGTLLKSLRLSNDISRRIEERIKSAR